MKLDFNRLSIDEIIDSFADLKVMDWQNEILDFLKNYKQDNCSFSVGENLNGELSTASIKKENIVNTVRDLNNFIGLKPGDTTVIPDSVTSKHGIIALSQAIEGKLETFCLEPSSELKIPYTGQDQNEVNFGLNYAYLTEDQILNSNNVLHRVEHLAVETSGITDEVKEVLKSRKDGQNIYEVFCVKSFPIAIRETNNANFNKVGEVEIYRTEQGLLEVDSPYFDQKLNTQQTVILNDDHTFRSLSKSEYYSKDSDTIINFDYIEDILAPHIVQQFVVVNLPDAETGKEVVSLVVETRQMDDINFNELDLKPHEIPQQTIFVGDFPKLTDRASIRYEVKRLLSKK